MHKNLITDRNLGRLWLEKAKINISKQQYESVMNRREINIPGSEMDKTSAKTKDNNAKSTKTW